MAEVTNAEVGYSRTKQPAQYEGITASVKFNLTFEPGEDAAAVSALWLAKAHNAVANDIWNDNPPDSAVRTLSGEVPQADRYTVERTETHAGAVVKEETKEVDKTTSKRGRPKKNDKVDPDEAKAAQEQMLDDAKNKSADVPDDSVPSEDVKKAVEQKNKDDSVPSDDTPSDDAPTVSVDEKKFKTKDLQQFINKSLTDHELSVPIVKEVLKDFGVERPADIPDEKAEEVRDALDMRATKKS